MPPKPKTRVKQEDEEAENNAAPAAETTEGTIDLACHICFGLATDVTTVPCCSAIYCFECIKPIVAPDSENKECTQCRTVLSESKLEKNSHLERISANKQRTCPHRGCNFNGTRKEVFEHVSSMCNVCPRHYLADNGRFMEASFKMKPRRFGKK